MPPIARAQAYSLEALPPSPSPLLIPIKQSVFKGVHGHRPMSEQRRERAATNARKRDYLDGTDRRRVTSHTENAEAMSLRTALTTITIL